jgi:formylmethanofuran--tetrahydromethanopterin N-formyltransferase
MSDPVINQQLRCAGVPVSDTFAEAFPMTGARVIITAASEKWALIAAREMTGYATSVIACDAEAGIEQILKPEETPDGRPGISTLVFCFGRENLQKTLIKRVGQCLLTCPTTAVYNGWTDTAPDKMVQVGSQLRFFGDGFQSSKKINNQRYWRIPVMEGEFLIEEDFGTFKGIAGGNLLLGGQYPEKTLLATELAVEAMDKIPGVITPFPGGIVRSGSKVGSRYKTLRASSNDAFSPPLKSMVESELPADCNCVYEIVIDGVSFEAIQQAMKAGMEAACHSGMIEFVSAGNYGGKLGPHHFYLRDLLPQ